MTDFVFLLYSSSNIMVSQFHFSGLRKKSESFFSNKFEGDSGYWFWVSGIWYPAMGFWLIALLVIL
ncbi:hypothetical protein ATO12_13415 [Aquimarina atlantica]|uniref:Uncharacterized protein n=1 Tax=Aquimarina atlantica TaxID=1317122 RepID=A0A023BV52_9FLAO|nr:hypothetical protein ATO12_13415 [Aquimarina atlantica]